MITAAEVQSMLRDFQRTVTLRRIGSPNVDVSCVARVVEFDPFIGAGGVTQFRRQITISNVEIAANAWPGPPRKGDQIIEGGTTTMTIQAVLTQRNDVETVLHRLETLGG